MHVTNVLASIAVVDFEKSTAWYGRLLGRPADRRPAESCAEWQVAEGATIQVLQKDSFTDKKDRAGWGSVALVVDSLDEVLAGSKPGTSRSSLSRSFPISSGPRRSRNPDGNVVTFVESLAGAG